MDFWHPTRFLEAFAAGVLPMTPETTRKHHELEARVRRLEAEAVRLSRAHRAGRAQPERARLLREALAALPTRLASAPPRDQHNLVRALVANVWVDNLGRVSVDLALG